jgi:hypothetical protein
MVHCPLISEPAETSGPHLNPALRINARVLPMGVACRRHGKGCLRSGGLLVSLGDAPGGLPCFQLEIPPDGETTVKPGHCLPARTPTSSALSGAPKVFRPRPHSNHNRAKGAHSVILFANTVTPRMLFPENAKATQEPRTTFQYQRSANESRVWTQDPSPVLLPIQYKPVTKATTITAVRTPAPARSRCDNGVRGGSTSGSLPALGSPILVPPVLFVTGTPTFPSSVRSVIKAARAFIC